MNERNEDAAREALRAALEALERGETLPVSARAFHMSTSDLWELAHELRVESCPDASIEWRKAVLTFKLERSLASPR